MRHSHAVIYYAIFIKLTNFVIQPFALYEIAAILAHFFIEYRCKNNGKPVKNKICENVKIKRRFWLILSRW